MGYKPFRITILKTLRGNAKGTQKIKFLRGLLLFSGIHLKSKKRVTMEVDFRILLLLMA